MAQVFITDLDGTLLDHETYDCSPALPSIALLRRKKIPLVLCSSKTAAEMLAFRESIQNQHPFIVENGGGIYLPRDYFTRLSGTPRMQGDYLVVVRGTEYPQLQKALDTITGTLDLKVRRFDRLRPEELADMAAISIQQARKALIREFDLPFEVEDPRMPRKALHREAQLLGLRITEGGRFLHLSGDYQKGDAVDWLLQIYQRNGFRPLQSVGLGDSLNDLGMLERVDIAVVIPNPHSRSPLQDKLPGACRASQPGPGGWNEMVSRLVEP